MGVLLMLLEGNFGHNLYRHNWLWYGGFLVVARHAVAARRPAAVWVYQTRVAVPQAWLPARA